MRAMACLWHVSQMCLRLFSVCAAHIYNVHMHVCIVAQMTAHVHVHVCRTRNDNIGIFSFSLYIHVHVSHPSTYTLSEAVRVHVQHR